MFFKKLYVGKKNEDIPALLWGRWRATLKFQMERCILLHISGKVFLRRQFWLKLFCRATIVTENCKVLKKAYFAICILKMRKNFGRLSKKCSINLIEVSGGIWFKKIQAGWHMGHKKVSSIKMTNGMNVLVIYNCKKSMIFF